MSRQRHPPKDAPRKPRDSDDKHHPPGEDEYGGGDFASPEIEPPTEDDKPLA